MVATHASPSAEVRARLDHPVIDADGHMAELAPVYLEFLKQVGGQRSVEDFNRRHGSGISAGQGLAAWGRLSEQERRENLVMRPSWWAFPMRNTLDRATASLPRLLYERMDELGMDFAVLYPSMMNSPARWEDAELRRAACRAYHLYAAELYGGYRDRLMPAGVLPTYTPEEAVEELEFAVKLGFKVFSVIDVRRPIPALERLCKDVPPERLRSLAFHTDTLAFESAYDYDPLWAKFVELKAVPAAHASAMGAGSRRSYANFMYNHIGAFAAGGEAMCRSIFMGGVTRRFPTLNFAFLECGVGWACTLLADIVARWAKRNPRALLAELDPETFDHARMRQLLAAYGDGPIARKLEELGAYFEGITRGQPRPAQLDEWAACRIERREDIRDLFVPRFYFGCEADDPTNAYAFYAKANPFGAKLRVVFSSDIGHWDVPAMNTVVAEAYEAVENGTITEEDFRDFMFTNPVRLFAGMDPDFFKGTRVGAEVDRLLARGA
jgi:predicted TIM-barrel fold metal-dependent hydrolase